jgi:hypothetical protein
MKHPVTHKPEEVAASILAANGQQITPEQAAEYEARYQAEKAGQK